MGLPYIKFCHQVNNCGNYADRFYNFIIDEMNCHTPSPLIRITCTVLSHAPLEWQKNKGVHPKASKSNMKVDTPDHLNHFNYNNDSGKNAFCCAVNGHKLSNLPGIAERYLL